MERRDSVLFCLLVCLVLFYCSPPKKSSVNRLTPAKKTKLVYYKELFKFYNLKHDREYIFCSKRFITNLPDSLLRDNTGSIQTDYLISCDSCTSEILSCVVNQTTQIVNDTTTTYGFECYYKGALINVYSKRCKKCELSVKYDAVTIDDKEDVISIWSNSMTLDYIPLKEKEDKAFWNYVKSNDFVNQWLRDIKESGVRPQEPDDQ